MKMLKQFIFLIFTGLFVTSCSDSGDVNPISTEITRHKYFPDLSSASGVEFSKGNIFLVGDDLPYLFTLNEKWEVINKLKISGIDSIVNGRSPKSLKADFESMALIEAAEKKHLLVLSSGSETITRDTAFLLPLQGDGHLIKKNMRPLYSAIKQQAGIHTENEINIEGLAFSQNKAYLFHRGNVSENLIVELNRDSFIDYLKDEKPSIPNLSIYHFILPSGNGVAAGFSGACFLAERNALLFTASLENTANEIDDGAILGSYIGLIYLSDLTKGTFHADLITEHGKPLLKKLEGISLISKGKNSYNLLSVCDNDNGSSDLYEFELTINLE